MLARLFLLQAALKLGCPWLSSKNQAARPVNSCYTYIRSTQVAKGQTHLPSLTHLGGPTLQDIRISQYAFDSEDEAAAFYLLLALMDTPCQSSSCAVAQESLISDWFKAAFFFLPTKMHIQIHMFVGW